MREAGAHNGDATACGGGRVLAYDGDVDLTTNLARRCAHELLHPEGVLTTPPAQYGEL